jgi:hypothetical protein
MVALPSISSRYDVLKYYSADDFGLIDSPGPFVGQPLWVPYFWSLAQDGIGESAIEVVDLNQTSSRFEKFTIEIEDEERLEFPELGDASHVDVWQIDGFMILGMLRGTRTVKITLDDLYGEKRFDILDR